MEFRVLGPLEVWDRDVIVDLGSPRIRAVCGLLLMRPGALVAIERFVDELWPEGPPVNARVLVRGYVSRLRRALRTGPSGADRVVTRKPGYVLRVEEQEFDLHRFERLVADARAACQAGKPRRADELYRQSHRLWRGDPLADVPRTASIASLATWLTEQRLSTREEWFDVALAAGQAADVVTELAEFVMAHPLRERPAGQLMLALYRRGRQADALAQYQRIQRLLAEEVGVDPGPELRRLHQRILDADPTLNLADGPPAPGMEPDDAVEVTATPPPRQLPRDLSTFTDRDRELADLATLLKVSTTSSTTPSTAPVVVLHGSAGVGKSALATHAAHLLASRFPDGQLHVNLRGATPAVEPLSSAEAAHQLLRGLGVAGGAIPAGVDEAAALLRTLVAARRILLVLDNAATAAQVRPLLPGCAVLITTRTRLTALEGATHLFVGPLSPRGAQAMLSSLVSDARPAAEPEAIRRLATLCGHLPLGLHLAAARLNARPTWAVRDLVLRLADERDRLTELAAGDIALRSSLTVSYTALHDSADPTDQAAARALRLIGLLPITDIALHLAAAVFDTSPAQADRIVERLLDAHLLDETTPGRFHMHDLTRLFARELGTGATPPAEQRTALGRLLGHFLATTSQANTLAYPHRAHHPAPEVTTPAQPLATQEEALRWLDEQQHNIIAAIQQAWLGPTDHARLGVGLALALHWHLLSGANDLHEMISLHQDVITAAERLEDRRSQAYAHGNLAGNLRHLGQLDLAYAHSATELALCRELGDRFGEQRALGNLGYTRLAQQQPGQAIVHLEQQLELARAINAPLGQAFAHINLGKAHHQLGNTHHAIALIETALAWHQETNDHYRQCDVHEILARIHIDLGHYDQAVGHATHGLDHARRAAYRFGEIWALTTLAQAHRLSGNTDRARHHAQQAIAASANLHGTQARTDALTEYRKLPQPPKTPTVHRQGTAADEQGAGQARTRRA